MRSNRYRQGRKGVITVTGGTLSAAGDGSPCVYSTGNITLKNVSGTATGSQAAVIEGKNSIILENCTLSGAGLNGVMLYQSTSGDAAKGTSKLESTDSTIKTNSTGPMFYVTNTQSEAVLTNTVLDFSSGTLANVAGNSTNNWGTPGSNGAMFTLKGINQVFSGAVTCDNISGVSLLLTQSSTFTGCINAENTAKDALVSLDASSIWNVTKTSYVTTITNATQNCSNIKSNGNTIYYDASNKSNAWLGGKTITLLGGGALTPKVK